MPGPATRKRIVREMLRGDSPGRGEEAATARDGMFGGDGHGLWVLRKHLSPMASGEISGGTARRTARGPGARDHLQTPDNARR